MGFGGFFWVILGFPCSSADKESTCNAGDLSLIPGFGRSLGEMKGYPLQFSGLENSMDHGVAKSWTRLSDFHFTFGNLVHSLYFIVFQIVTFYCIMFLFVLIDVFGLNSALPNIRLAILDLELFYLADISFPILFHCFSL